MRLKKAFIVLLTSVMILQPTTAYAAIFSAGGGYPSYATSTSASVTTASLTSNQLDSGVSTAAEVPTSESDSANQSESGNDSAADESSVENSTSSGEAATSAESESDSDDQTDADEAAAIAQEATDGDVMVMSTDEVVDALGGRDYVGQVTATINGTTYILIGNEQQLRAIGTSAAVTGGAVYSVTHTYTQTGTTILGVPTYSWVTGDKTLVYTGDADLDTGDALAEAGTTSYISQSVPTISLSSGLTYTEYYDSNDTRLTATNRGSIVTGLTYSSNANYIIFRDIDLSADGDTSNWSPLYFSGTMLGAVSSTSSTAGSLFTLIGNESVVSGTTQPTISNVTVYQSGEIDSTQQMGVGFFSTIGNELDTTNYGVSAGTAIVSNIKLSNVSVTNASTAIASTTTVISAVTDILGGVAGALGSALDVILGLLGINVDLGGALESLLEIRSTDESAFATGAFAGRIYGDAEVSNCTAENVYVSNVKGMTGGFVGYTEGATEYSGLSTVLGGLTTVLEAILDVIPALGLGDLIVLLLDGGLIDASQLIPTGYYNPVISGCTVSDFTSGLTIGSDSTNYAGGFVGNQIGSIIENCTVSSTNDYSVAAQYYAGGFAGVMRNAVIRGALNDLGVETDVPQLYPQSLTEGSSLVANVTVTAGSYAGGFTGAMANSYAVNDVITGSVSVNATGVVETDGTTDTTKALAGGFTGAATLGWITDLGSDDAGSSNLLTTVNSLLGQLLTSNPDKASQILSLVGISPSMILGVQLTGGTVTVSSSNDYAGGLVGRGDGTVIAASDSVHLAEASFYSGGRTQPNSQVVILNGLSSVTTTGSYAGGIAGSLGTASVGGLVNNTVGLGGYLPFEVSSVTVTGVSDGYTVKASEYAGGAIGLATGGYVGRAGYDDSTSVGDTAEVALDNLASVTATNYAAGFIGVSGPGDLAGSDGLDLLGLGAITVSGLLSVAEGVVVQIDGATVDGISAGYTVSATGSRSDSDTTDYVAGGFIAQSNSTQVSDGHVTNILSVTATGTDTAVDHTDGTAGGFVGISTTGDLASVAENADAITALGVTGLLSAVTYLVPSYEMVDVTYVNGGYVAADIAGGFAGDFQAGTVDNSGNGTDETTWFAVYNIDYVSGGCYAGGFGGHVTSGALASSGGGISILGGLTSLNIGISDLLTLVNAYVPSITKAGVSSTSTGADGASNAGFTVSASHIASDDSQSGSAGGFIGYGSGVQVSYCDVTQLRHTSVTEPGALEGTDGSTYFDSTQSTYAVTAPRYSGGFIGKMDIGDAASLGSGLGVLGSSIALTDVLSALSVVVSTIEHSDVTGGTGGFAILASDTSDSSYPIGFAGGFAGEISGGHIQDSNSYNFSYIISQVAAGGYVGNLEPGDVASALGSTDVLSGLVSTSGSLTSLVEDFVPSIRNSETTCIPCGGAVRAQAASDTTTMRGMAGGYCGHNEGGQIWGLNTATWKSEDTYTGTTRTCAAVRIRSVYGAETAGGFTGYMESADTASTGSLSLLYGLINVNNLLDALSAVYPTEENTEVSGPLRDLTLTTWNSWSKYVGAYGGYGSEFANQTFETQEALDTYLEDYIYGTNVVAGRSSYESGANVRDGGVAGGYVGLMVSGTITNGQALDTKYVSGMRAAGGFAGAMLTGGAASLGSTSILGLNLDAGNLVSAVETFVPVVKSSSVTGYRQGMTVTSTVSVANEDYITNDLGFAGGYVGYASGAQIWGDSAADGATATGCNVNNLLKVTGPNCIGGFAGLITAASTADVDTNSSDGFLQALVSSLTSSTDSLANIFQATVSTVRNASVNSVSTTDDAAVGAWGFTVDGSYTDSNNNSDYALAAGGFAGSMEAVVAGDSDGVDDSNAVSTLDVSGLRGVEGGQYAGGFVGRADLTSLASVADSSDNSNASLLLSLLKAGEVSVLDSFRTYIYYANVSGVSDGFTVKARESVTSGTQDSTVYSGDAGGFAGALLNGHIENSNVMSLNSVLGLNYAGGFVGHLGKSATVDADSLGVADGTLLDLTAGVLDVWGSHIENSSVAGIADGYTVTSAHESDYGVGTTSPSGREVAGGFAGYADLAKISDSAVTALKKVTSGEISGGFAGETSMAYLVDVGVDSQLVAYLLDVLDPVVAVLGTVTDVGLIDLSDVLPSSITKYLELELLNDNNLLYLNLGGLKVGIALGSTDDVLNVTIADSTIELKRVNGTYDTEENASLLSAQLIKGNRTTISDSSVTGILTGYDVFGGDATQETDGTEGLATGYSGGFVGLNNEGLLQGDSMVYADTIRGTSELVDPFAFTKLKSSWNFNSVSDILGTGNTYTVYRSASTTLTQALTSASALISSGGSDANTGYSTYTVSLFSPVNCFDAATASSSAAGDESTLWIGIKDATRTSTDGSESEDLDVYVSSAEAVLMMDTVQADNSGSLTPEPTEGQDPCEEEVNITLQKVWNDYDNADNIRPSSVKFLLTATYTDADGNTVTPDAITVDGATANNPVEVTLSGDDASAWSETWSKVVAGLPVAFEGTDGSIYYYTYSVTAETVSADGTTTTYGVTMSSDSTTYVSPTEAGYTSAVSSATDTTDADAKYVITVTNTHQPALPETGGMGLLMLILIGAALLAAGTYWMRRRRNEAMAAVTRGAHAAHAARSDFPRNYRFRI